MLTEKQRKFVECMVATGGTNASECVRQAGYAGNNHVMWENAYDLMRNPKILAAIREECRRVDESELPMARAFLRKIIHNPDHEKHFDALKWYFGVLGISPVTKSETRKVVEHTANLPALEELKLLAQQLKIKPAEVIDVTPTAPEEQW